MKIVLNAGLIVLLSSGIAFAKMEVQLSGGWNGKTVPKG